MIFSTKKLKLVSLFLLTAACSFGQSNTSALLPLPNHIEQITGKKNFTITSQTTVKTNLPKQAFCLFELQRILRDRVGQSAIMGGFTASGNSLIELSTDPGIQGKEHYVLDISENKISIKGATQDALFYGLKTLDQILLGDVCNTANKQITPIRIDDEPRFGYRALMLDPARHFLPVEDVKFYIDQMAKYKYNVLQLHLTDDQGWRVEIKKHPGLTETGAFRNPQTGPNGPDNGYYTQQQLKDLIQYAADRNVEIIPELDIPGHTVAVLATYPELGCTHTDTIQKIMGKTVDLMLCANNDKVYTVYDDIIKEIAELFPSSKIHLGGDEAVIEKNWTKCDRCQSLMKQLGYTKESQLMNYFFDKILASVRKYGKEPILWCELDNIRMPANEYLFDYPKDATLITWRAGLTPKCIELTAKHGNSLIMAPGEYTYLDYPQLKGDLPEFNNWGMPVTTLETCYQFDPGYGLPAAQHAHIQGICGTLWGEAIKDINRVTYMTFPRGLALAEAGWTQMEYRDWDSFKERMYPNLMNLMKQGVSIRIPFEIVPR
ncbi:beta-N-acetylhexosaminidase [uncultured Parabacteroides sp.]|jgi:hexosaminidase|uniref:beta-N-acetylhexosaminidase n=1 Tax=uncultured Parabacteroides sp. TaxID=512312 RepID=UPI0025D38076|nr:beta-N-acetylhexosaminidase [uncultured Parabacteroides sp.]